MEFGLNEQQQMLKKTARDFFQDKLPKTLVRELIEDEKGYSTAVWKEMAELGWHGLMLPEEYEGFGGDFVDMAVVLEEMGRALLPGPFIPTVIFGGLTILKAGNDEQKKKYLPAIANGELILTFALQDSSDRFDAAGVTTKAKEEGENFIISGVKKLVPDAHVADYIICVARTKETSKPEDGISLFIVEAKSAGLKITAEKLLDGKKMCTVSIDGVKVPKTNVLGAVNGGWSVVEKVLQYGIIAHCADSVGGTHAVLDLSVTYARDRMQFDRPIGSYQAIKHKCANMLIDLEGARPLVYWASWAVDTENPEAALAVSMAKGWCSDAYRRVSADGIQLHGGMGFTWDHDMHLYYKRAKTIELNLGDSDYHRELVAQDLERQALAS